MSGKPFYLANFHFSRFNAKHSVQFGDRQSAKAEVLRAVKDGIWVVNGNTETYWGPEAIAKVTISVEMPDDEGDK